ncbi:hypothetical protein [Streptomyces sp. NPDC007070]|uniref:hypothetical protein n=1 Tax=Streptomyces sp. NPDC007070 TaxID=3154312 RepID=UPI0033EA5822
MTAQPSPAAGPAPVMRYTDDAPPATGLADTARQLPAVLSRTIRLAWHADRRALLTAQAAAAARVGEPSRNPGTVNHRTRGYRTSE